MFATLLGNLNSVLYYPILIVLLIAGGTALKALADYEHQKKEGKDPVFKASAVGLEVQLDFWV